MRKLKGDAVPINFFLLMAAIFGAIIIIISVFTLLANYYYGNCWSEPVNKLTNELKDGKNVVDFKSCVEKVIFTNSLTSQTVTDEIDVYKCDSKVRIKTGGSFIVIVPVDNPPFLVDVRELFIGEFVKPECIWKSYTILKEVVFEGSKQEHCIYISDTPTPNVKNVDKC